MLKEGKFGYHEAISLIVITINAKTFFTSPATVVRIVGTAGWYMTLISAITAAFLFTFMYLLLKRFPGKNIMEISDLVLGKFFSSILLFLFAGFLLIIAGINTREFSEVLKVFVLPESPLSFVMIIFTLCVASLAFMGLETLARFAKFFIFLFGGGFLLVILLSTANFRTHYLYPLLGYGIDRTIVNGMLRSSFYGEVALVGVMAASLHGPKEIKRIGFSSLLIAGVFTSIALVAFAMVFPYTTAQELMSPMYAMASQIDLGAFLQRLDPVFLFLWNFSSFIEVAALFYGVLMIYCHIFRINDKRPVIMPMAILLYSLNLIPNSISEVAGGLVQGVRNWGWVMYFGPSILLLTIAAIRKKRGETKNA